MTGHSQRSQGADLVAGGVRYRTWAPGKKSVDAVLYDMRGEVLRTLSLGKEADGYWSAVDPEGRAGDRYKYRLDGEARPDPASRFNPVGVHGPAEVVNPEDFSWRDQGWVAPPVSELIIYELHIGTFTPAGTFRAAIEKLDHVAELGATALEIMPVADFPGRRNWGYDGVLLYAPTRTYGTPNELRALVDAAHERGLAVILDVVYNHLGPDGNYLGAYSAEYFYPDHKTPWGDAFNFELKPVRDFFVENAPYWRREFHIDGFRLDATHAILDNSEKHVLAEIAEVVHSLGGFVTAEDERSDVQLFLPRAEGGIGLDAAWSDDFHHIVRVMLTGVREGYYRPYEGTIDELAATLEHGWLFEGKSRVRQRHGEPAQASEIPPAAFIFCVTNHDQIGNHAMGTRLNKLVSPAAFRAASALLCLVPFTPLLLMGQEWAASTPFQYFTDHKPQLGRLVTEGRRSEFSGFAAFRDPVARARIPDPQAETTFQQSKLRWEEMAGGHHAATLLLYREFLHFRRQSPALRDHSRDNFRVMAPSEGVLQLIFGRAGSEQCLVVADLVGGHARPPTGPDYNWELRLSSNENRFGGEASTTFEGPEVRVFRAAQSVR
ncbi:MAG: malto-oligosyltrehalose trehalohydrolase [Spartobacteria bacterium]